MFKRIIVPTDGSDYSWRAVEVGEAFARQCDAELELLEVVSSAADVMRAEEITRERLAEAPLSVPVSVCARVLQRSVGATIADHVADVDGGLIVMSTFGRGRSEAILGSVALDVLRAMDGPVVAVGPKANNGSPRLPRRTDRARRRVGVLRDGAAAGRGVGHRAWRPARGSSRSSILIRNASTTRSRARTPHDSPAT